MDKSWCVSKTSSFRTYLKYFRATVACYKCRNNCRSSIQQSTIQLLTLRSRDWVPFYFVSNISTASLRTKSSVSLPNDRISIELQAQFEEAVLPVHDKLRRLTCVQSILHLTRKICLIPVSITLGGMKKVEAWSRSCTDGAKSFS